MEVKNYFAQDDKGNILPNASVYLYKKGTNELVSVFDKNGSQKTNPFAAESNGLVQFSAADGEYDLRISSGGRDYAISVNLLDTLRLHFENVARNIGCTLAEGSFDDGSYITDKSQLVLNKANNKIFKYNGTIHTGLDIQKGYDPNNNPEWLDITHHMLIDLLIEASLLNNSVTYYGASQNEDDNTESFSLAAQSIPAAMGMSGDKAYATRPNTVLVRVPAGNWNITDYVDTNGRDVIWFIDQGAVIAGVEYLHGTVVRDGQRLHKYTFSTMDNATGLSTKVDNKYPEKGAETTGISIDAALSITKERATLAHYVENRARSVLFTILSPTFTETGIEFSDAIDTRRLRVGMLIDTTHDIKYSGAITGWSENGKFISVSGWYLSNGILSSSAIPPTDGHNAIVNPITKAWGDNTNVFITTDSGCTHVVGEELGVFNNQSDWLPDAKGGSVNPTGTEAWGYDSVNLGTKQSRCGYIQRGNFHYGFECTPVTAGVYVKGSSGKALYSESTQAIQIQFNPNQTGVTYQVDKYGNTEAGSLTTAMSVVYDWHSSGNNVDYDVRMVSSGGSQVAGSGLLSIYSGGVAFSGQIRPLYDNTTACGTALQRFSVFYGVSGTINQSDEDYKTWCDDTWLTDAVMDVWETVPFHAYQWNSSIDEKGADSARIHYGFGAQTIGRLFEEKGIDPHRLALFCYDEWYDKPEVIEKYIYGNIIDDSGVIELRNVEEKDSANAISQLVLGIKDKVSKIVDVAISSGDYNLMSEIVDLKSKKFLWIKTREEEFIAEQAIKAGSRYGLRYEQCLVLEAACNRRRANRLQEQIDSIKLMIQK